MQLLTSPPSEHCEARRRTRHGDNTWVVAMAPSTQSHGLAGAIVTCGSTRNMEEYKTRVQDDQGVPTTTSFLKLLGVRA